MSSNKFDTYIALAVCIAIVSVATNVEQTIRFVNEWPTDIRTWTAILGSVLGQASLAFAMLAAVLIGRHVLGDRLLASPAPPTVETFVETQNETGEPPASFLSS